MAEPSRKRRATSDDSADISDVCDEKQALRAEIKRLKAEVKSCTRQTRSAKAETKRVIEALQADEDGPLSERIVQLQAENAALRERKFHYRTHALRWRRKEKERIVEQTSLRYFAKTLYDSVQARDETIQRRDMSIQRRDEAINQLSAYLDKSVKTIDFASAQWVAYKTLCKELFERLPNLSASQLAALATGANSTQTEDLNGQAYRDHVRSLLNSNPSETETASTQDLEVQL